MLHVMAGWLVGRTRYSSERLVTADRDAMAVALVRIIVPDRAVLDAAVIPERNGIRPPLEAHAQFRRLDATIQHPQDRVAFVLAKSNNPCREISVDEEALLPGDRMRPNDGELGARKCLAGIVGRIGLC